MSEIIRIGVPEHIYKQSVDVFENTKAGQRAVNACKRAGLMTIEDVLDCDDMSKIRNCGAKTISRIKSAIYEMVILDKSKK